MISENNILSGLNSAQIEAVTTIKGPLLVLSGAGTGKTRVLTTRFAYIINQKLARPWEVLALTFTNKAANEMKFRISKISPDPLEDGWVGTFHSICLRILRANYSAAGLVRDFIVYGEDEQKSVLKNVINGLGLDTKKDVPSDWIEKIQSIKDKGLREDHISKSAEKIYYAYNAELTRLNAVDFGDIILKTLQMFVAYPEILSKYQHQFKYIMVDEFQDTNNAQHQLLKMLAGGHGNIACVGDDDQSIYSWRGAEIKNILEFEKTYPDAKIIRLETNYRSTGAILGAANSLIRNNRSRLGKELQTATDSNFGEKININEFDSDFEEASSIADAIEDTNYSENVVLIRNGSLSRLLEEEFTRRKITYKLVGATKFYDRAEIRDVIAYVRLLVYPFDDISFLRIIGKPKRGFGDVALGSLHADVAKNKYFMIDALRSAKYRGKQLDAASEFLSVFDFDWNSVRPVDAVTTVLEKSGYLKMWHDSKDVDAPDRIKNIDELLNNVIAKYDTLPEFLEQAALMTTDDDADGTNNDREFVSIMTIHAAKGLEFNNVFLIGAEQGLFPSEVSVQEGNLEEERRLAYVAITRARRRVSISHAASRMMFGQWQHNPKSQFITEIDKEFIANKKPADDFVRTGYAKRRVQNNAPLTIIGRLVKHETLGIGVVIEQDDDILTIAFKDKGIKKVEKKFVQI